MASVVVCILLDNSKVFNAASESICERTKKEEKEKKILLQTKKPFSLYSFTSLPSFCNVLPSWWRWRWWWWRGKVLVASKWSSVPVIVFISEKEEEL